jgi:hypothetical protein
MVQKDMPENCMGQISLGGGMGVSKVEFFHQT